MNIFQSLVDTLFKDRHSTRITFTLPTKLLMALETLVYLRNMTSDNDEVDRDYVIGLALAHYLQKHLVDRNELKIASIPPAPLDEEERYTSGRTQYR